MIKLRDPSKRHLCVFTGYFKVFLIRSFRFCKGVLATSLPHLDSAPLKSPGRVKKDVIGEDVKKTYIEYLLNHLAFSRYSVNQKRNKQY